MSPVDATVTWKRVTKGGVDVHELPNTVQVIQNGLVLQFRNFRSADAGSFKCVAENKYGEGSDTAVVFASSQFDVYLLFILKIKLKRYSLSHFFIAFP